MEDLEAEADELQNTASQLLDNTPLRELMGRLGVVTQTGSSTMGLMMYPDLDFSVQTNSPQVQDAIEITPEIFSRLNATALKIADFRSTEVESASYFVGIELPYSGKTWQIAATVSQPGPIATNPPELAGWLKKMTQDQRKIILRLKKDLILANRYSGAHSQPPYTFRSVHLYEGVLKGKAKTIQGLESYFHSQK